MSVDRERYVVFYSRQNRFRLGSSLFKTEDEVAILVTALPSNSGLTVKLEVKYSNDTELVAYNLEADAEYLSESKYVVMLKRQELKLLEHRQLQLFLLLSPNGLSDEKYNVAAGIMKVNFHNQNYFKTDETMAPHKIYGISVTDILWSLTLAIEGTAFHPYTDIPRKMQLQVDIKHGEHNCTGTKLGHRTRYFNQSREDLSRVETQSIESVVLEGLKLSPQVDFTKVSALKVPARFKFKSDPKSSDIAIIERFGYVEYLDDLNITKKVIPPQYCKNQHFSQTAIDDRVKAKDPIDYFFLIDILFESNCSTTTASKDVQVPRLLILSLTDQEFPPVRLILETEEILALPNWEYLLLAPQSCLNRSKILRPLEFWNLGCDGAFKWKTFQNFTDTEHIMQDTVTQQPSREKGLHSNVATSSRPMPCVLIVITYSPRQPVSSSLISDLSRLFVQHAETIGRIGPS